MKSPLSLTSLTLALCLSALPTLQAAPVIDHLKAGDQVPAGTLRTDAGEVVDLQALLAGKRSVLIFYRGGWCPYCNKHLSALAEIVPDLEESGYQILAISPDRPEKLRAKPDLGKLPYTLLSDSPMTVSGAFGITFKVEDELVDKYMNSYGIDLEGDSGESHHLLPYPSVFIVDGKGVIRFAHVDPNYKVRMDPEEIVETARSIQ